MLETDYTTLESFVIYMCVEGDANIESPNKVYNLKMGETLLITSCVKHL